MYKNTKILHIDIVLTGLYNKKAKYRISLYLCIVKFGPQSEHHLLLLIVRMPLLQSCICISTVASVMHNYIHLYSP